MADMGIYSLWPVFTALNLDTPISARAWATHTCSITNTVSGVVKNDFSYPTACTLRFEFAARDKMPAMDLFWYDGGMKPQLPEEIESHDVEMGREGIMFIGDEGAIMAGFHGQQPRLFTKGQNKPLAADEVASQQAQGRQRHHPWIDACQGGDPSPGSFLNAAAITDTVNLGTVALRAGNKVLLDSENMKITNVAGANKYLYRDYRKGWKL